MACMLTNVHNPSSTFMQLLNTLCLSAGGLRKPQWQLCSSSGWAVTYEKLRKFKDVVSEKWNLAKRVADSMDPTKFIRVSFDNWNANRSFARLGDRMLNLITCQFSQAKDKPYGCKCSTRVDPNRQQHAAELPIPCEVCELHASCFTNEQKPKFKLHLQRALKQESDPAAKLHDVLHTQKAKVAYAEFLKTIVSAISEMTISSDGSINDPEDAGGSLQDKVKYKLHSYVTKSGNKITFATIDEGHTATLTDIGKYLAKVMRDLLVGTPAGPAWVIVCGDQQTFALMLELKRKYPESYGWLVPYVGEWHLLFNSSQWLCEHTWSGGLEEVAKICHLPSMKPCGKWRDTHHVLTVMWTALSRLFYTQYLESRQTDGGAAAAEADCADPTSTSNDEGFPNICGSIAEWRLSESKRAIPREVVGDINVVPGSIHGHPHWELALTV